MTCRLSTNPATVQKFQEDVLKIITSTGQAVSWVKQELRYKGWKNLGRTGDFEDMLEEAGFKLERIYDKGGIFVRQTNVTL